MNEQEKAAFEKVWYSAEGVQPSDSPYKDTSITHWGFLGFRAGLAHRDKQAAQAEPDPYLSELSGLPVYTEAPTVPVNEQMLAALNAISDRASDLVNMNENRAASVASELGEMADAAIAAAEAAKGGV